MPTSFHHLQNYHMFLCLILDVSLLSLVSHCLKHSSSFFLVYCSSSSTSFTHFFSPLCDYFVFSSSSSCSALVFKRCLTWCLSQWNVTLKLLSIRKSSLVKISACLFSRLRVTSVTSGSQGYLSWTPPCSHGFSLCSNAVSGQVKKYLNIMHT